MSKFVVARRALLWGALVVLPAAGLSAVLLANLSGCGSGDCVIITTGTKTTYSIEIEVTSEGEFGALQLEVFSNDCNGEWIGRGDEVECESLVEAIVAANHVGPQAVKVGFISLDGIETPTVLLRCRYESFEEPVPSDFRLTVVDAADTESSPLDPAPVVEIGDIEAVDE